MRNLTEIDELADYRAGVTGVQESVERRVERLAPGKAVLSSRIQV